MKPSALSRLSILCAGLFIAANVRANEAPHIAAQALFDEARWLTAANRYAEACPKFAESQRLDPAIGTQFYWADCLEHIGQLASAWAHYIDVVHAARAAGQKDREEYAHQRARRLEPRLPKLRVDVEPPARETTDLQVSRDGILLGVAQWGAAIPVDPGRHVVTATAPGKRTWTATVEVTEEGATASVLVPPLQDVAAKAAPSAAGTTRPNRFSSAQGIAGIALGAAGVVGIGVGTAFGIRAIVKRDESNDGPCDANNFCDATGKQLREETLEAATISTISFAAGAAAIAGGVLLLMTTPTPSQRDGRQVALVLEPARISLRGEW